MKLEKNDVFITNFWGCDEVCLMLGCYGEIVSFVRLEAVRDYQCATLSVSEFDAIEKRPLHRSVWYNHVENQPVYATITPTR
jgi:hypothetical protein